MDSQKIDLFLASNSGKFEGNQLIQIREKLQSLSDDKYMLLQALELKDPTTILLVSIFVGSLGVDRFLLHDTSLGVIKLLTCGGGGIWTIIDWFTATDRTKAYNYNLFMEKIAVV